MHLTKLITELNSLPPFVVSCFGRSGNGKAETLRGLSKKTGWSRLTVIRCTRSLRWDNWELRDISIFLAALRVSSRRWNEIKRIIASGEMTLPPMPASQRRLIMKRLASCAKKLEKLNKSKP